MSAHHHHRSTYRPWTPRQGDRVQVRDGQHDGEVGRVLEGSAPPRIIVKLDMHEIPRVFAPHELVREEQ